MSDAIKVSFGRLVELLEKAEIAKREKKSLVMIRTRTGELGIFVVEKVVSPKPLNSDKESQTNNTDETKEKKL